jgi:hypothetical protein
MRASDCREGGVADSFPRSLPSTGGGASKRELDPQEKPGEKTMLRDFPWTALLGLSLVVASIPARAEETPARQTTVAIDGTRWLINGRVTYPGAKAEGLLMNVRMVNATFEDRNRDDFDPDANTDAFLAVMPEYVGAGVRAFTFNLQGGMPGYEGALNSAFEPDGSLQRR